MRIADIAYPPDVQTLVSDLDAMGCQGVGLYAINWAGVPDSVRSPAYVQAVLAAGKWVLPIIAPGDSPGGTPQATQDAVRAWGTGSAIAFDAERYSEPASPWIDQARVLASLIGTDMLYAGVDDQNRYGPSFSLHWLADWTFTEIPPPPGYDGVQWTDRAMGPSGTRYDLSDFYDTLPLLGKPGTYTGGSYFGAAQ